MHVAPAKISAPVKAPDYFGHAETGLAKRFGVGRNHLRKLRHAHLEADVHWVQKKGGSILYSDAGMKKLSLLLATKPIAAPSPPIAAPSPPIALPAPVATGMTVTLIAWSRAPNPRVLLAYRPGTDPADPANHLTVRVRSNENFLRGMELPARYGGTYFELTGPPPRHRGRW
jgi:hypothetical protein